MIGPHDGKRRSFAGLHCLLRHIKAFLSTAVTWWPTSIAWKDQKTNNENRFLILYQTDEVFDGNQNADHVMGVLFQNIF